MILRRLRDAHLPFAVAPEGLAAVHRLALQCWAIPLCLGVSIFILWVFTRWNWLMFAGVCTIYAGMVAFALGLITLAFYVLLAFRVPVQARPSRRRLWSSTIGCTLLLSSNFPVAFGVVLAAEAIASR